jgi:uncharacterized protein YbjT (DUF2867 family)
MTILVTGSTGIIGSQVVANLAEKGAEVHALTRSAISSPTPVHARMQVDARQGGLTGFGRGWAGSRAF